MDYGYYVNPGKKAQYLFNDLNLNVKIEGKRHIGAALGSD